MEMKGRQNNRCVTQRYIRIKESSHPKINSHLSRAVYDKVVNLALLTFQPLILPATQSFPNRSRSTGRSMSWWMEGHFWGYDLEWRLSVPGCDDSQAVLSSGSLSQPDWTRSDHLHSLPACRFRIVRPFQATNLVSSIFRINFRSIPRTHQKNECCCLKWATHVTVPERFLFSGLDIALA